MSDSNTIVHSWETYSITHCGFLLKYGSTKLGYLKPELQQKGPVIIFWTFEVKQVLLNAFNKDLPEQKCPRNQYTSRPPDNSVMFGTKIFVLQWNQTFCAVMGTVAVLSRK